MMQPTNNTPQRTFSTKAYLLIIGSCLAVFACVACLAFTGAVGFLAWSYYDEQPVALVESTPAPFVVTGETAVPSPTPANNQSSAHKANATATATALPVATPTLLPPSTLDIQPPAALAAPSVPARAAADLQQLLAASYPPHDYYEVAQRLGQREVGARTITRDGYRPGDYEIFIADEVLIEATLMAVTEHAYFWVDDELNVDDTAVVAAAETFETTYYPLLTNLFGQVWTPGIDGDTHFTVLHLKGALSDSELGYFSDVNQYPTPVYGESNEQEMVYLNMSQLELGSELYYGTLVHEVQHLIQWNMDANETTWLNEGLAQLAEIYVGLETVTISDYLDNPGIRLNTWNYDEDVVDAHYGGAYLYSVYIWEQLGEAAVQELSRHPANGVAAVDAILRGYQPERDLAQFTADWAVANYLDDAAAGPHYYYQHLDTGRPYFETRIKQLPFDDIQEVNQFGVHYVDLRFGGPATITFAGETVAELLDAPPYDEEAVWFVPAVNDTDAQLTAAFDLSGLDHATLKFNTWYDLEKEWDFAYVLISADNGASWELLVPDHASPGDYGPAFNDRSADQNDAAGGWVKESISLDSYVGRTVLVRFEVLTDATQAGRGFAIDNITVPELAPGGTDSENNSWEAAGFVQIGWQLPQQWRVQLIQNGDPVRVSTLPFNELNQGQWQVDLGDEGGTLVITALTPFATEPAAYWLNVQP